MSDENFIKKTGHFKYLNGHQYYGEYLADLGTRTIFRHGCGTYVTADCCTYKGEWNLDRLVKCAYIKYLDETTFCGRLDPEGNYYKGTVQFTDGCRLLIDQKKKPALQFEDMNGTFWDVEMTDSSIMLTNK